MAYFDGFCLWAIHWWLVEEFSLRTGKSESKSERKRDLSSHERVMCSERNIFFENDVAVGLQSADVWCLLAWRALWKVKSSELRGSRAATFAQCNVIIFETWVVLFIRHTPWLSSWKMTKIIRVESSSFFLRCCNRGLVWRSLRQFRASLAIKIR